MSEASVMLEEWERSALLFVAEQGAVTLGQLARFLGAYRADVEPWLALMERSRFVAVEGGGGDEEEWLRLKVAGHRASRSGVKRAVARTRKYLERCRMATEVRLAIEEQLPTARWVARRVEQVRSGLSQGGPAGVVEIEGERHCVEIVAGTSVRSAVLERVHQRLKEYDAVLLWCSASALSVVEGGALASTPRVLIRELPSLATTSPTREAGQRRAAEQAPELDDPELEGLVELLADQQALTERQLERFLGIPGPALAALLAEAEQRGLVLRGRPVWEPDRWVWPSARGLLAAGEEPGPRTEMLVDIDQRRALTEVRLSLAEADGQWLPRRRLSLGSGSAELDALLVRAEAKTAICVELQLRAEADVIEKYAPLLAAYDEVWCYCEGPMARRLQALAEREGWLGLELRPLIEEPLPPSASVPSEVQTESTTLEDLPAEALWTLEAASGVGREAFGAIARRLGPGARAYQVEIGGKQWRLARSPNGWSARAL